MKKKKNMGSVTEIGLSSMVLVLAISLLVSPPVLCNEDEDNLLQGLNSYRTAQKLPPFAKNDKADCLADEIADKLEDERCTNHTSLNTVAPGSVPARLSNYQDLLSKCKIDPNKTQDGLILPVCVPNRVPTLVLTNYTDTGYSRYLNDSRYTGAGAGSEDEWMVVILTTDAPAGSFASGVKATAPVPVGFGFAGLLCCLVFLWSSMVSGQ